MTIPRNLSFLAEGASPTGVLGTANGGTGLSTVGTSGQVLTSNGTSLSFATPSTTNPAGSTGQVQYNNGGAFGAISSGTSGQVLTSAGSGAAPTWSTPSAGAMTLISTLTASSSSSLAWTGLSGYDKYQIIYTNLNPGSTFDVLQMQIGTGSSPTYITSGYRVNNIYATASSSTAGAYNNSSETAYVLTGHQNGLSTATSGFVIIEGMTTTVQIANGVGNGSDETDVSAGTLNNSTTPTAIKLYMKSGSTFSGKASLYGISS